MKGRKILKLLLIAVLTVAVLGALRMRGMYRLARIPLPLHERPLTPEAQRLAVFVRALAGGIGPRNFAHPEGLRKAEDYVKRELALAGAVHEQRYAVRPPGIAVDVPMRNFIVTLPSTAPDAPVLVIGAHYDTALDTPGADDNASGVAALLELARRFKGKTGKVEVRFAAYGSEEPPFFGSKQMGSAFHAGSLKAEGRKVEGMISLEMLGYYNDAKGSQTYPPGLSAFFPGTASFIGAVSNLRSRGFLRRFSRVFTPTNNLSVVAASLPGWITEIGLSDHKCYWDEGYPAIILTDTSFLRYPHYHMTTDTSEKLDYERMADVVNGMDAAISAMMKGT